MKKNLDITKPRYNEQIWSVPRPFVKSWFHCDNISRTGSFYQDRSTWPKATKINLVTQRLVLLAVVFTHVASIYADLLKQKRAFTKKKVQLTYAQDCFGIPTWSPMNTNWDLSILEDEYHYENDIFSMLSSACGWTSAILGEGGGGWKRDSRRHSTTVFLQQCRGDGNK